MLALKLLRVNYLLIFLIFYRIYNKELQKPVFIDLLNLFRFYAGFYALITG